MLYVLRLGLLGFVGLAFTAVLSPNLQRALYRRGLLPELHAFGDQYHRTHLAQFKESDFARNRTLTDADKPTQHYAGVDLYTIGDSFTEIDTSFYAGHRNAHIWLTFGQQTARLDSMKKNVLIIEILERIILERLLVWPHNNLYITNGYLRPGQPPVEPAEVTVPNWLFQRFNADIEWRIDATLFDYPVFVWFKELKAKLMQTVFDGVPFAVVSADGRSVFYDVEADSLISTSSFFFVTDRQIDSVVTTINYTRDHYRRMGFDEVYYAFVPNKVTVVDPRLGSYNHLIERIEANPRRRAPLVRLYDTLKQHPDWYHRGDGHWNRLGKRYWLQRVNAVAAQWSTTPEPRPAGTTQGGAGN